MGTNDGGLVALQDACYAAGLDWTGEWLAGDDPPRLTATGIVTLTFGGVDPGRYTLLREGWRDAARDDAAALDLVEALDAHRNTRGLAQDVARYMRGRLVTS